MTFAARSGTNDFCGDTKLLHLCLEKGVQLSA